MTLKEKNNLKQIRRAIKEFPKVIQQRKKAYEAQEKIVKAFMPMAKKLQRDTRKVRKQSKKTLTTVHAHPLHVPVSKKNPTGTTIRDQHLRHLKGTYLDPQEIDSIFKSYDRKSIIYPTAGKLTYKNSDKYDDLIAVWTDYFNKKFRTNAPLDPDVVKALIASESRFREDPRENKKAFGITQITPSTFKIIQDPKGEAKDFIFKNIRKKDLKDPTIAIPMGTRWLFVKKKLAEAHLGRSPNAEEIILEYKGLLFSKTDYSKSALNNFKENYATLKKK